MYIISVGTDYCHAYAYSADDGEPGYDQESLPVSSFAENPIEGKVYHWSYAEDGYVICTSQGTSPLPPENDPEMVESAVKILEEII